MTTILDNLDSDSEDIHRLFPKCRRRDVNLNPVHDDNDNRLVMSDQLISEQLNGEREADDEGEGEEEEEEEEEDTCSQDSGPEYLRDIEIAGGREVFSQSKSKAARKRFSDDGLGAAAAALGTVGSLAGPRQEKVVGSRQEKAGVWEVRGVAGRAEKRVNPQEMVTETVFSTEVRSIRRVQSPVVYEVSGGGADVVVFDDIGERSDSSSTDTPPNDFFKVIGTSESPERSAAPRVIGGLPIADYEGSPRRYGPRPLLHTVLPSAQSLLSSPSVFPPRPGFPQRVQQQQEEEQPSTAPSDAYDYLYEFSETRKVLEEFFKPSSPTSPQFHELDYNLHRQAGNSYVGQRLAKDGSEGNEPSSSSPSKQQEGGTPDLISLRDHEEAAVAEVNTSPPQPAENTSPVPDEDLAETEVGLQVGHSRNFTLSPETTDCDSNDIESEMSLENEGSMHSSGGGRLYGSMPVLEDGLSSGHASDAEETCGAPNPTVLLMKKQICEIEREIRTRAHKHEPAAKPATQTALDFRAVEDFLRGHDVSFSAAAPDLDGSEQNVTPPPPAPQPHRVIEEESVEAAIKDIRLALQRTKPLRSPPTPADPPSVPEECGSPVWVPRHSNEPPTRPSPPQTVRGSSLPAQSTAPAPPAELERSKSLPGPSSDEANDEEELDTDLETDRLLGQQRTDDQGFFDDKDKDGTKKKGRNKEDFLRDPSVLIEGVLFRARYLGSTQLVCEGQPTKSTRMMQAEEAVSRIKAPEGENQPSTEVDLFISTEKIMVLNTDLKEIMMDHALRSISYIADIGTLVVLMARRRYVPQDVEEAPKINRTPKMICHVFESDEAQFIAQSIGQAFQVAYMEFLKANGIEDHSFVKEMDYQEVLNSQEIFGDELQMFAKKEMQKEVVVPKAKGEILGVVIVESGWGSMLPTVVIANLAPAGAAARCGQLNIGDQIIAINGVSLVGLPLSTCQNYIKNTKTQTVVKLTVVPCAPVVEVKIKRPDTKYQLGFSVQNGVICSLLRGGIAERGGVRVGHRIIEINNQSVVAVPHEKIVNLLATSVGEILMKTMPTSMFRLLTGQETPLYI